MPIESKPSAIEGLEKIIGKNIKKVGESDIWKWISYCIDNEGTIVGLNLRNSGISDLTPLAILTGLKRLYLDNNQIKDLSPLAALTALGFLRLDDNQLTDRHLLPLAALTGLEYLRLNNNHLTDLLPLIPLLSAKRLKRLHLQNNNITHLPEAVFNSFIPVKWDWDGLDGLFLKGNPLESPPIEIVKKGHDAVAAYFKQLKTSSIPLLQCKLLLVGGGEVGKTTLMKKLKDPSFTVIPGREETTHGINIIPWQVPCRFSKQKNDTVNTSFWDFGGQDIYHATHQFFLTKRSLYILVWEARKEEDTRSFDYWLNVVKLLGSGSPVIVVMNKADIRTKSIDEATLKKKFPSIVDFLQVSCLENKGLSELTELIRHTLESMPHLQDLLPAAWLRIRDNLKTLDENYTASDRYFAICEKHEISRRDAEVIGDYLHDLGVILYFRGDPLLADTVILNPEWATKAVYALIDTKEVIAKKGSFDFHDLKRYWDPVLYPESKHPQIVRLMEKFELCFNFLHTHKYFIPELLPGDPVGFDKTAYSTPGALHFQYRYDFMPEGILSRFISRLYYLIHHDRFWKYGVELQFDNSTALVLSQPVYRRMQIVVAGTNKSELLAIIRSHFTHIHETLNMLPGVHYHSMIPCNCPTCCEIKEPNEPNYYPYSELIKFLENGITTFPCKNSFKQVGIDSLLKGFEPPGREQNLLQAVIEAAVHVQGLAKSMKPDEDSRTGLLCLLLNEKGFFVKDQTRWGQSETGQSMGRPDGLILSEQGLEAVLEAFSIDGFDSNAIDRHCKKIFGYDPTGLENNYIVVYCNCNVESFTRLWKQYKDHLPGIPFTFPLESLNDEPTKYAEIKMARAVHRRQGKEVGIHHVFIHMGGN